MDPASQAGKPLVGEGHLAPLREERRETAIAKRADRRRDGKLTLPKTPPHWYKDATEIQKGQNRLVEARIKLKQAGYNIDNPRTPQDYEALNRYQGEVQNLNNMGRYSSQFQKHFASQQAKLDQLQKEGKEADPDTLREFKEFYYDKDLAGRMAGELPTIRPKKEQAEWFGHFNEDFKIPERIRDIEEGDVTTVTTKANEEAVRDMIENELTYSLPGKAALEYFGGDREKAAEEIYNVVKNRFPDKFKLSRDEPPWTWGSRPTDKIGVVEEENKEFNMAPTSESTISFGPESGRVWSPKSYRLSGKKMDKPVRISGVYTIDTESGAISRPTGDEEFYPTNIRLVPTSADYNSPLGFKIISGPTPADPENVPEGVSFRWVVEGNTEQTVPGVGKVETPSIVPYEQIQADIKAQYGIDLDDRLPEQYSDYEQKPSPTTFDSTPQRKVSKIFEK